MLYFFKEFWARPPETRESTKICVFYSGKNIYVWQNNIANNHKLHVKVDYCKPKLKCEDFKLAIEIYLKKSWNWQKRK